MEGDKLEAEPSSPVPKKVSRCQTPQEAQGSPGVGEGGLILLSIDGGGYRGLIPATLCKNLEKELSDEHGYEVFLCQHVDGVAGTSTGSIISMGLAVSHPYYPSYPKYKASEFPTLYTENGERIFSHIGLRALYGLLGAKYDRTFLDNLLMTHFGEATLKGSVLKRDDRLPIHALVPAYNITAGHPYCFQNFPEEAESANHKIREIVGASTAAPSYFPAKEVPEGSGIFYVDGGVSLNNPAAKFTLKMKKLFPKGEITMISLGTGKTEKVFPELQNAGKSKVKPIVELFMTSSQQEADDFMSEIDAKYIRIQPLLEETSLEKTDISTTTILEGAADKIASDEPSEGFEAPRAAYREALEV